jgi:hypothetical protein
MAEVCPMKKDDYECHGQTSVDISHNKCLGMGAAEGNGALGFSRRKN